MKLTKQEKIILLELLSDYVKDTEDEVRLNNTAKDLLKKLEKSN